jgi:serine phosphatase RsbU (regulator of sigma subunit)
MKEFRICVLSRKLADELYELTDLVKFRNRIPIKVIHCSNIDEAANCHMVVVDGAAGHNLWSLYSRIRTKGVLMVAENLEDYKKSMISFVLTEGKLKFIVNKTKFEESPLVVNERLYSLGITKEGEWKSIFEKFSSLLQSGDKEVKIEKAELQQMLSMYSDLEKEKNNKERLISRMEDSLNNKLHAMQSKLREYDALNVRIEQQKKILSELGTKMMSQRKEIALRETEIGKQRTVISIIGGLTLLTVALLLIVLRINSQRRKANNLLSIQKNEIETQKQLVDIKQKEILDSINYAKRIQTALMASNRILTENLGEHFILFKPKDIVAGDFYWAAPLSDGFMYITADSTGHGVPGAFMSVLNISKLNDAINQKRISRPDLVLNEVKTEIVKALNPDDSLEETKDGMDATLCKLDLKNMKLQYAAANNSFCIVRNNELLVCKADKMPVGKTSGLNMPFTLNEIKLEKNDMIYTFTDGYCDQFGGPQGKKLKLKKMREILLSVANMAIDKQREIIRQNFLDWKGELEQVDDVLVIGVRV